MSKTVYNGHVNKSILVGSLKVVPTPVEIKTGHVATIELVTNSMIRNSESGEPTGHAEWHHVVLFNSLAKKVAKIGRPGMRFYVEGAKRTRTYDSKGKEMHIVEIVADICEPMDAVQVSHVGEANE